MTSLNLGGHFLSSTVLYTVQSGIQVLVESTRDTVFAVLGQGQWSWIHSSQGLTGWTMGQSVHTLVEYCTAPPNLWQSTGASCRTLLGYLVKTPVTTS